MRNVIIMIGPPCSGKSVLGKMYAGKNNIPYISSGDIARNMGDKVQNDLNNGKLAPEDAMRNEIKHRYHEIYNDSDIVLDGFPRFKEQLQFLIKISTPLDKLIFVIVDTTTGKLYERAKSRNRQDDAAIINRLTWYMENTLPMVDDIKKMCNNHNIIIVNILNMTNIGDVYNIMRDSISCHIIYG